MGCSLHDFGEHGPHGHSHGSPKATALAESGESIHSHKSKQNMNVRAALIHVISDFVQSCGVFLAALVIYFKPEWAIIDPICTFLFSVLVLITTIRIMKDAVLVSNFSMCMVARFRLKYYRLSFTSKCLRWKLATRKLIGIFCGRNWCINIMSVERSRVNSRADVERM